MCCRRERCVWPSSTDINKPVDYASQNKAVHELFDDMSDMASVVHAFRKGGTRQMQEAGCDLRQLSPAPGC